MTRSIRLILAEDDDFLRQLLQLQCESLGVLVTPAHDGEEAISLALSYEHDILLMDINMPTCDGIQAMTLLRQLGYDRPIVAMSANEVTAEGFTSVLKKPLNEQSLRQLLQQETQRPTIELVISDDLRNQFIQSLPLAQQQIEQACLIHDWQELRRLSHKLKGTAGSFGLPDITHAADQLQQALLHNTEHTEVGSLTAQLLMHLKESHHE